MTRQPLFDIPQIVTNILLAITLGISGWMLNSVILISEKVIALKENQFTISDWERNSRKVWATISQLQQTPPAMFREYLDQRFQVLEQKLQTLDNRLQNIETSKREK